MKKRPERQPPASEATTAADADVGADSGAADHRAGIAKGTSREPMLIQVSHRAMATEFVVLLPPHASDAVELAVNALEHLDSIESALTVYNDHSEVSRVNRLAGQEPVRVSRSTFDLLQAAIHWSQRTQGAFDVTAGPLVKAWGFTRRSGRKPSADEISSALERVGYQYLQLSETRQTIQFARPGMSINLGAIGKGDALDTVAGQLRDAGVDDFLIHGGNSSVIASGDQIPGSGQGWGVGLAHPTKPKRRLAGVWLRNMALATSGSGKQFFHHQGRRYGHVIDPRTGYPGGDLLALTVLMPSARDADACATGLFVAGTETMSQLAGETWMPPRIAVRPGNRQDAVEIEHCGEIPWVDAEPGANPPIDTDA